MDLAYCRKRCKAAGVENTGEGAFLTNIYGIHKKQGICHGCSKPVAIEPVRIIAEPLLLNIHVAFDLSVI